MSQIALPLDWPADERDDAFIVSAANAAAVRHLDHLALWPVRATVLTGPRKSGRSLLARIFAAKYRAMVIDDAERRDEEALFHAWNRAQETRVPLLMVTDQGDWRPTLADLRSRLAATPVAIIGDPDDALIAPLIEKLLARRGLTLPREVAAWLPARLERSYVALLGAVDILDREMLARRHRLTLPLTKRALEEAGVVAAA